ncbi:MAG: response regulator [bacterium]|nr:response regulator [bacterium]
MKPKILLVEDDPSLSQIYKTELELDGFDVQTADNGETGLATARNGGLSLILLDIVLPKLNGLAVLEELKKDASTKNIPVIIITNFGQEDNIKKAFALGTEEVVLKYQTTPAEVVKKIKEILAKQSKS